MEMVRSKVKLVLFTSMKSHMGFEWYHNRWLEWRNGRTTLKVLHLKPTASNWFKLDPYCTRQKYSSKNLVFWHYMFYGDICW